MELKARIANELTDMVNRNIDFFDTTNQGERQSQKLSTLKELNKSAKPGQILFAGDSITEDFPVHEMFMDETELGIYNRGVGGYTTQNILDHMDTCILDLRPSKLFLLIGTNDLGNVSTKPRKICANIETIVKIVKERSPGTKICVQAIYPAAPACDAHPDAFGYWGIRTKQTIDETNALTKAMLGQWPDVTFLEVPGLADEAGHLRWEYTRDGLHLNISGYRLVKCQLRALL
jgi:lysophospholipase L1-like esterase